MNAINGGIAHEPQQEMSAIVRDSFVFYQSYFDAIEECPIDEQLNIYKAIMRYAIYGEEIEVRGTGKAMFLIIKPLLEKNRTKWLNSKHPKKKGAKCGAPKGNKNAAKNKECNPDSECDPDSECNTLSGKQFSSCKEFRNKLETFATSNGYTQSDVTKFLSYNFDNSLAFGESDALLDKKGNVIENVFGAFLNFVNSGYNREEWLKEHGIKKGESLNQPQNKSEVKAKQKQNKSETKANAYIPARGFFNFASNVTELEKFAVSEGYPKDMARKFITEYMKNSPRGDKTSSLFGSDGLVVENVCDAFLDYAKRC